MEHVSYSANTDFPVENSRTLEKSSEVHLGGLCQLGISVVALYNRALMTRHHFFANIAKGKILANSVTPC
jgi:hypothetical protein